MENNQGFTLIELIITIIVVSVGVLALIAALSFGTGRSINSELMTTGTTLAQERLEQLIAEKRANGYSSALLAIGTTTDPPLAAPYADYTRTVEICNVDVNLGNPDCTAPSVDTGYKRITVTVTNTRLPAESTVQAVTLVTDY
jgi:prepilin-type N-terminal cleavage/methylation domain-containing protein